MDLKPFIFLCLFLGSVKSWSIDLSVNQCSENSLSALESILSSLRGDNCMSDALISHLHSLNKHDNDLVTQNRFQEVIEALYDPELLEVCSRFGDYKKSCETFINNHKLGIISQIHIETLFSSRLAQYNNLFCIKSSSYNLRKPDDYFRSLASKNVPHSDDGRETSFLSLDSPLDSIKSYLFFIFSDLRKDSRNILNYGDCIKDENDTYDIFGCIGEKGYSTVAIQPADVPHLKSAEVYKTFSVPSKLRVRASHLEALKPQLSVGCFPDKKKTYEAVGGDGRFFDVCWKGDVKNEYGYKIHKISKMYEDLKIDQFTSCLGIDKNNSGTCSCLSQSGKIYNECEGEGSICIRKENGRCGWEPRIFISKVLKACCKCNSGFKGIEKSFRWCEGHTSICVQKTSDSFDCGFVPASDPRVRNQCK